jgi:hypothetical protein
VRAPRHLRADADGATAIVEIRDGARVSISRRGVSGPGAGTCASGGLGSGIRVVGGGHLDLRRARVAHVHDTPIARCGHQGVGVLVGDASPGSGSATIRDSEITDSTTKGMLVVGPREVSADGIDALVAARLDHNVVAGNDFAGEVLQDARSRRVATASRMRRPRPSGRSSCCGFTASVTRHGAVARRGRS